MLGAAGFSLAVQQLGVLLATSWWSSVGTPLGGLRTWTQASPVLAASIGLLVGAWRSGQVRAGLSRGWVVALVGLPLLLAVGALSAGVAQIAADRPYLPSRTLVPNLLGMTYRAVSPTVHLLLAVLGPLFLLCAWGRWPRRVAFGAAGVGIVGLLVGLAGQRGVLTKAAKDLIQGGEHGLLHGLAFPGLLWMIAGLCLVLVILWALPRDTPRVGRWIWCTAGLLVLDPVPVVLGWFLPRAAVADTERLSVLRGAEVHRGGALVDLTGGDLRLDGVVVDEAGLSAGLRALGHPRLRPRVVAHSSPAPDAWGDRIRTAVRFAAPASATVGDVADVLEQLVQHGVHELHWLARPRRDDPGPLAMALRQPAFTVLLDVPVDRAWQIGLPWAWVGRDGARLFDPRAKCQGTYQGEGWLDSLDESLSPCRDGVVVLPDPDLALGELTVILDRLGGTGRGTMAAYRVALIPPGPGHELFRREEARP